MAKVIRRGQLQAFAFSRNAHAVEVLRRAAIFSIRDRSPPVVG